MNYLWKGISGLCHPVFLPFFSLLAYLPLIEKYEIDAWLLSLVWLVFAYYLLPVLHFRVVRKINLIIPNLDERRTIYRTYTIINIGFTAVSFFIIGEYVGYFIGAFLLHLILLALISIELKASWHSAAWSFISAVGMMVVYNIGYQNLMLPVLAPLMIMGVVVLARWQDKAHTPFELVIGIAAGVIGAIPVFFI